jgi:hypothetical protein
MAQNNLAELYIKYLDEDMTNGKTWDDFFDYAEVSKDARTDFACAAILKQAQELLK